MIQQLKLLWKLLCCAHWQYEQSELGSYMPLSCRAALLDAFFRRVHSDTVSLLQERNSHCQAPSQHHCSSTWRQFMLSMCILCLTIELFSVHPEAISRRAVISFSTCLGKNEMQSALCGKDTEPNGCKWSCISYLENMNGWFHGLNLPLPLSLPLWLHLSCFPKKSYSKQANCIQAALCQKIDICC